VGATEPGSGRVGIATVSGTARRDVAAACIGNAVEWYDYAIFGALVTISSTVYFPSHDPSTRLAAAFAVYGTAFLARPLGAVYFGRRADQRGRRWTLVVSVLLMTAATAGVGLLPGYAAIGVLAPITLLLLRVAQGFGAGGELGVAAAFIVEHAPSKRRGTYGAWHTATLIIGTAAGLAVGATVSSLVATDAVPHWSWRAAFLLSLPLGFIGLYLRRRVRETEAFTTLARTSLAATPLRTVWNHHRRALMTGFTVIAAASLAFNTFFVFLPNHLAATRRVPLSAALGVAVVGLLLGAGAALVLNRLTDQLGRRPVVLTATTFLAVVAVPLMVGAEHGSVLGLAIANLIVGVLVGGMLSMALVAEMFPAPVRATGMSLTAGLGSALFGGTAPLIAQLIVERTGLIGPGLYVAATATVAVIALMRWPETAFRPLT
jgi:MFS transporter, MHS family, proline/betaine transporter